MHQARINKDKRKFGGEREKGVQSLPVALAHRNYYIIESVSKRGPEPGALYS
ncbi:hypothetical protein X777_15013 [Ooceraea biroi]|uniref:Uncharacterized protein n=1 Tax=Ooceraea biroi TaxID=2015173 RepID=A0A026WUQ8_OOCBI|nr:hypothetical protein X777_15013 [Ooceraea biroi]